MIPLFSIQSQCKCSPMPCQTRPTQAGNLIARPIASIFQQERHSGVEHIRLRRLVAPVRRCGEGRNKTSKQLASEREESGALPCRWMDKSMLKWGKNFRGHSGLLCGRASGQSFGVDVAVVIIHAFVNAAGRPLWYITPWNACTSFGPSWC